MRQIEVINLETIIDVTAETSNVEILVQDYDAELVERFALEAQEAAIEAEESADIATAQASIATAQATIATTQAGIATTQAGIATTQAGIATTKANEASASAASALASEQAADADRIAAQAAASTATTQAGIATTQAGIATTKAGEASASASTASTQAGIATTKANQANQSAINALASEQAADADRVATAADRVQTGLDRQATAADRVQTGLDASTSTTQAGIATTQAGIATTQAGISTTQAGIATTQAGNALTSANNALASQNSATASASTATTQAGIATTQAGIATTQAGIATTQASNALTSANNAAASAASAAQLGTSTLLTGFSTGANSTILATDTILQGFNKTQGQINARVSGTGTSGQVAFWNGTSSQTGDNDLFWDNTNKRFGIGRTTPFEKFELYSSNPVFSIINNVSNSGSAAIEFKFNAGTANNEKKNAIAFSATGSFGRGNLSFVLNSAADATNWNIANDTKFRLFGATGNVLIQNGGTFTDAGFRLDVNGTARATVYHTNFGTNSINLLTSSQTSQTSDRGVFIGSGTFNNASAVGIAIGNNVTCGTGTGNVAIGYTANASGGSIAIASSGISATASGSGVAIGANANSVGGFAVKGSANNGIGVAILGNATAINAISIGGSSTASGNYSVAIGDRANVQHSSSIAFGLYATTTANRQLVIGGNDGSNLYSINDVYIGGGVQDLNNSNATSVTINASGGNGTDRDGGNITIAGGKGTGAGTAGSIVFSTSNITTSGTTLQTLAQRMRIFGSTGNVLIQNGGTFTDAGFRLDVNGTARVQGALTVGDGANSTIIGRSASVASENAGNFNTISLIPESTNNSIIFDVRPSGTNTNLTGFVLRDSSTAATGSNQIFFGRGNITLPSTSVAYFGALVTAQASGNSFHLGFVVSNSSLNRFEPMRIWNSGNVYIQKGGTYTDISSAILNVNSTTQGFLPPRLTTTQKNAIASPATGLQVYDSTENRLSNYNGVNWQNYLVANSSGNVLINTSIDNGYRLDVSGSTRVNGDLTVVNALISNQENLDVDSAASEVIAQVSSTLYIGVFFDFVIKNGSNMRSGTVYAVHDGTNVEFTETSTADLGNTSGVTLSVDLSGGNIRLLATTTTDNWVIKSLVRGI